MLLEEWIKTEGKSRVLELQKKMENVPFVQKRWKKNVTREEKPPFTKDLFWEKLICCLLTSQQKSGPDSRVDEFMKPERFPLTLERCVQTSSVKAIVASELQPVGFRFAEEKIPSFTAANLEWLQDNGWTTVSNIVQELERNPTQTEERKAANILEDNLEGFGPKQSRNLLQMLGLTKFEIPIDSRVRKWLIATGIPMPFPEEALKKRNDYEFILDIVILPLSSTCGIYPCMLDAMIFASPNDSRKKNKKNGV